MSLLFTDRFLTSIDRKPAELELDFACYLYEKNQISPGKAAALVGVDKAVFEEELLRREISISYGVDEFNEDMRSLGIDLQI